MSAHRVAPLLPPVQRPRFWPPATLWKHLGSHLLIPLILGAGMALAYLGAFHQPAPHDLPVAIVGEGPAAQVFAQTMNDKASTELDVTTVSTAAKARDLVEHQKLAAAYEVDGGHATIIVSTASSETVASAAQKIFLPIAYEQKLPVTVDDVRPTGVHDSTGQGLFFLMVALTVGSYAAAIAIAAVAGKLGIGWRVAISAATGLVIAGIGAVVAGPIFQVLNGNEWSIWLLASLYSFGIITIGVGLHPVLGRWTTPTLTILFVMLNITSCGGIFPQTMQPAFFAGLNTFWNGAAWLDAARSLTYFPGQVFGFDGLRLALWATAGVGLIAVTHLLSVRRRRIADESIAVTREEEESVVAA
ncbi:hypothetical protein [Leifsonia poae]|uniref:Membrane protein n=1 Tax=Leifsonia poae TaxID=110933 RepID=A0A9W6H7P6_9MICO|nr:hypothetical protein [Leifsonia poae]GLJ75187.1 membrane protein [Leifsonia poae]